MLRPEYQLQKYSCHIDAVNNLGTTQEGGNRVKTKGRVAVYLQTLLAAVMLTCIFGAHTAYAELTEQEKNSSYGFFLWLSKNEELSEADRTDAAVAAQLLKGTVSSDYSGQVFNNGSISAGSGEPGTAYSVVLQKTSIGAKNDATALDNVREAIQLIELGNTYRAKESLHALNVSSSLMAMSEVNANYQFTKWGHTLAFNALENLSSYGSGLSQGFPSPEYDPYEGWYTEEKNNLETNNGGQTGHYLTLTDRKGTMFLTGFGFTFGHSVDTYNWTRSYCSQHFSDDSRHCSIGDGITPDDYLILLKRYECSLEGHEIDTTNATVTKEATCLEDGLQTGPCKKCGETVEEVIQKLGHDPQRTDAKAATCTEAGNTEYYTCSRCKKLFLDEAGKTEITQEETVLTALGHDMEKTEAKAATCIEAGNTEYYTCSHCEKLFFDEAGKTELTQEETVLTALGHDMEKTEAKAATCTEAGNTEYYTCSRCEKLFLDEAGKTEITQEETVLTALGHDMEKTEAKAATCTEAGNIEYYTCSRCKKLYSDEAGKTEITQEETVLTALGHDIKKVAKKDATCKEEGNIEHYACSRCKTLFSDAEGKNEITREEVVIKVAHVLEKTEAKEVSCTEDGNIEYYTCTVCGKLFSDAEGKTEISKEKTVIKAGHVLAKTEAKEATCTENGNIKYYTCSRCGKIFSDEEGKTEISLDTAVIKASHVLTKTAAKEATCTEDGNIEYYTCSRCNKLFSDAEGETEITKEATIEIAPGHETKKVEAKEATCSEAGNIEYYTCSRCGELFSDAEGNNKITKEDTLIIVDHDMEKTEAKAATCTEQGNTEYYTCRVCGKMFSDQSGKHGIAEADTVIAKRGHTWSDWTIITPATTSSKGTKERTCSECNEKEIQEIPKQEEPKAVDGTAVGKGASVAAAEAAIVSTASDEGPSGTTFAQLSAKVKKAKNTSITLTWNRVAPKYFIYGNKCGNGQKFQKIAAVTGTSFTQSGLAKGTYYKYMVVAVDAGGRVVATSKTMHAATSGKKVGNPKKVTVKKKTLKLKPGKKEKIKASIVKPSGKKVKNHRKLSYESMNPKVATVAKNGSVKAVAKGATYIYVYAQNGVYAKVKVKVK